MYLNKYKNIRKLGKGGFGEVYLVADENEKEFALKLMKLDEIAKQPHMREYLDGEIECMQALDSPYIIKLYEKQEDKDYIYLLLEFCEVGDLTNVQSRMPNRVFTVEKSAQILADVIRGLEDLHSAGYLHRDIKGPNVLVKKQNGKEVYKLADFGFSKKSGDVQGTVLGTEFFMSPEIFHNEQYGFEVDMWAFGVLFYFMLNMEYPFKLNANWTLQKKELQLIKLAANFSYKKVVSKSKKQLLGNATAEIEDLFVRMFEVDVNKRITFQQIRQHPIFVKYFPEKTAKSVIYKSKFTGKNFKNEFIEKFKVDDFEGDIRMSICMPRKTDKKYPQEEQIIAKKKDELDFLRDNAYEFLESDILQFSDKIMLSYNLLKYYVILLRNLKQRASPKQLKEDYPAFKWGQFITTLKYKELLSQINQDLSNSEMKFHQIYERCESVIDSIEKVNPKFRAAFHDEITDTDFQGPFRDSYRKSTVHVFGIIRESLKTSKKGNKLNYMLSLLVISHAFNNIFSDLENNRNIFHQYLEEKKKSVERMDYSQLREWMSKSDREVLNNIAKMIIKVYFQ